MVTNTLGMAIANRDPSPDQNRPALLNQLSDATPETQTIHYKRCSANVQICVPGGPLLQPTSYTDSIVPASVTASHA